MACDLASNSSSSSSSSLHHVLSSASDTHFVLEIYDSISETLATKVISFTEPKFVARGLLSNTSYIVVVYSKNRRRESNKMMQPVVTADSWEAEENEENFLKMQDGRTTGDEARLPNDNDLRLSSHQG